MGELDIPGFLLWYFAFLFSLSAHEAAHAWAAYRGGDPTAYLGGQVTLNPLPHIQREPLGTVLVPFFTYFRAGSMMGWASAPYDPLWADRHPRRAALMSAAGPAANLVIASVVFLALKVCVEAGVLNVPWPWDMARLVQPAQPDAPPWFRGACQLASILLSLNLLLFCFNLLPLPPLDGSGILFGLFPEGLGGVFRGLRANPILGVGGLLVAWYIFPRLFGPLFRFVRSLLLPGV